MIGKFARYAAFSATFFSLALAPAMAGDGAAFEALGVSADGRYFAYEQYGVSDGSTFDFSEIHVLDIENNTPMTGFPVRYDAADELSEARAPSRAAAAGELARLKLAPVQPITINGEAAPMEEILAMDIYNLREREQPSVRFWSVGVGDDIEVKLTERPMPSPACADLISERTISPEIALIVKGKTLESFADKVDLRSLNCPDKYGVAAIYRSSAGEGDTKLIVVLGYYPVGFEGPDRRFRVFALKEPVT